MRETLFWKNEKGFHLKIGDAVLDLSHRESREVLKQMIQELPGLPGGVKAAWELARQPSLQPFRIYDAVNGEVFHASWYVKVFVGHSEVYKTRNGKLEDCIKDAKSYVDTEEVLLEPEIDDLNDKRLAEKKADEQKLEAFLAEKGMTMKELARAIQKGEL